MAAFTASLFGGFHLDHYSSPAIDWTAQKVPNSLLIGFGDCVTHDRDIPCQYHNWQWSRVGNGIVDPPMATKQRRLLILASMAAFTASLFGGFHLDHCSSPAIDWTAQKVPNSFLIGFGDCVTHDRDIPCQYHNWQWSRVGNGILDPPMLKRGWINPPVPFSGGANYSFLNRTWPWSQANLTLRVEWGKVVWKFLNFG